MRLHRAKTGLLVIDVQERLLPAILQKEALLQNALRLVRGCAIMGVPTLVTEQYRKGLGPTVNDLAGAIPDFKPIEKDTFSACGVPGLTTQLRDRNLSQIVLCGIESHVCVAQTCVDLLAAGFQVFVVADAVGSRTGANCSLGLERMRDAGATIGSTEMALFELLERAGTEEFKQVLSLVK